MIDDRTPVLVGAAQWCGDRHPVAPHGPVDVLEDLARRAGAPSELDAVVVTALHGWEDRDPVATLARRLGVTPRLSVLAETGGESGVRAVNFVAERIAAGELDAALVVGCNLRAHTRRLDDDLVPGLPPGSFAAPDPVPWSPIEEAHEILFPNTVYPMWENARRAHLGLDLDAHAARLGALMQPFTEVAARNPYAWFPTARAADELVTPTPANRMVSFPYPKYLNAVRTDQGAALVVLSAGRARALGVPVDEWVYWWGGAHAGERHWWWTTRPSFTTSPGMVRSNQGALAAAGIDVDDVSAFDLYSCFSIAVSMACDSIGVDERDPRPFTITGGLPYAGGPGSAYTLQAIATAVDRLRERPDERILVTGNGMYFTKHAAAVLSGVPRATEPRPRPAAGPEGAAVEVVPDGRGPGTIETYTVLHDRDGGAERGVAVGRLDDGRRFVAHLHDDLLVDLTKTEGVGRRGFVADDVFSG